MGESTWVDLDAMQASSSALDQVADRTAGMVTELETQLMLKGEFWGDDEPGKLFAESYVPGVEQAMQGMQNLVAALRTTGRRFAEAADLYSQNDLSGAHRIDLTNPAVDTGDLGVSRPGENGNPVPRAVPENPRPTAAYRHDAAETAPRGGSGQSRGAETPASSAQPAEADAASPRPADGAGSDGPGQARAGTGDPAAPNTSAGGDDATTATPTPPAAGGLPGGTPVSNTAAAKPVGGPRTSSVSAAGQPGPAGRAPGTSSPGSLANNPWTKPPTVSAPASSSVTPPQNGLPPRTAPPRPSAPRAEGGKGSAGKPPRDTARPLGQRPQTSDPEAMRIAREMAARHNLEIHGFETAGLHERTVRQIAAALDHVLARYPLPLRGIEIAPLGGEPARTEDRATTAGSGVPEPWIVLDAAAAANPRQPTGPAAVAQQSTEAVHREQQIYATIVRAFGGVLDIAGGGRARAEAQRALITEYLRVHGSKGDTLARVVSGYKRWRAELSESCFERDIFAPTLALSQAFADVELNGDAARPPQKVLHRLLVTLARPSDPGA